MFNAVTSDRNNTFRYWKVVLNCLIDTNNCGDIEVPDAMFARKMSLLDSNAGSRLDPCDFPSLWIEVSDFFNRDSFIRATFQIAVVQCFEILVILLDADPCLVAIESLPDKFDALDDNFLIF